MGMAAEANRITYGNWRLPCGAAAFFIHKTISRNGGINMKELWNTAQVIFAAIGGWLGYFLGGCDGLLIALVVFVAVDYVTGVMCAISDKKLSSEVGFKGICRKVLIFLLVGIANILECAGDWHRQRPSHGGHLLLPLQRGCEPFGERGAPGASCAGEDEGHPGTAP